jgi:hypothetical protein
VRGKLLIVPDVLLNHHLSFWSPVELPSEILHLMIQIQSERHFSSCFLQALNLGRASNQDVEKKSHFTESASTNSNGETWIYKWWEFHPNQVELNILHFRWHINVCKVSHRWNIFAKWWMAPDLQRYVTRFSKTSICSKGLLSEELSGNPHHHTQATIFAQHFSLLQVGTKHNLNEALLLHAN